jgi:ubiquinone biosynthesis UbiH/UbiF/VisC/COQ6 family hydroxylase
MDYDICIIGGGPAGLSLACALQGTGLRIAVVERQERASLAEPAYDGREIALTRRSVRILEELGAWARVPVDAPSPLKLAKVLNGASKVALSFDPGRSGPQALGALLSNHLIRKALFECVADQPDVTLLDNCTVTNVSAGSDASEVVLADGRTLRARLLVAADSRFSKVREQLGIAVEMNPVGRAMLVCRVEHDRDHGHVATEWFDRRHTIAMLPLNGRMSSAVLTLPLAEAERVAALDDVALGAEITARYRYRLGSMRVASSRHLYPLVTTFADRFAVPGAALVGDAAVGMHPVTAHGFNLGLAGAERLAREIRLALRRGTDWGGDVVLRAYDRGHRRACRPLYAATNMIVRLYTDTRPPAWIARHAAIRLGRRLPFVRSAVRSKLLHA